MKTFFLAILLSTSLGFSMTQKKAEDSIWDSLPQESLTKPTSSIQKKYLLLDFWASWCEPCKKSFPFYEMELAQKKSEKFNFFTVALDAKKEDSLQFLNQFHFSGIALWDPKGQLAKKLRINALPSFFIIDDKDQIVFQQTGFSDDKKQALLKKLRELDL